MFYVAARSAFVWAFLGGLPLLYAADSAIGIATANGDFQVNDATVRGNATLFDGTLIETGTTPSQLRLNAGPRIALNPASKARIHSNRLILEAGTSDVAAYGGFEIDAGDFRIAPDTDDGAARVVRAGKTVVQVAALRGSLRVYNSAGLQIANVFPDAALSFEPQGDQASGVSNFTGCLLKKEGKFVLYDRTTRIIVELRGEQDFASEWGNQVQVIGTTDPTAKSEVAAQVMDVTSLTRFSVGGCDPVASAIAAELPAGQPAAAPRAGQQPGQPPATQPKAGGGGMSGGAKVAIIAGLGGGGAAAAILATQSKGEPSRSP